MDLNLNKAEPRVMFVDLNSCFATCEQQANRLLRNKPMVVAAYASDYGCVISPSMEAKRLGIKVGHRVSDAKQICKDVIVHVPTPSLYRDVHQKFCKIFKSYTPYVQPCSIDEAVLRFEKMPQKDLIAIAKEIKMRMRSEIGEWISNSIGISTNRFLAKTAASLVKPDGLVWIDYKNVRDVYSKLKLIDLCGINIRNELRLNKAGIYSPLEFLNADMLKLKKQVFESIVGYYWYLKLRGYECEDVEFGRKSFGQSYALPRYTDDLPTLSKILMKLCEKSGRRLRRNGYHAGGVDVGIGYTDGFWHKSHKVSQRLYSGSDLYKSALRILKLQPEKHKATHMFVSFFNLRKMDCLQLDFFNDQLKNWDISKAADAVNDRFGEYTITPAAMMGMQDQVIDRVPFGGVKDIMQVYFE